MLAKGYGTEGEGGAEAGNNGCLGVILLTDFDVATWHKMSDKSGACDEMMSVCGVGVCVVQDRGTVQDLQRKTAL